MKRFAKKRDWTGVLFTAATALATLTILAMLVVIVADIFWKGSDQLSLRFVFGNADEGMFDTARAGVFPMIFGTAALVVLMTLAVVPVGVISAVYLTEYARWESPITRIIRGAINNLAGVPSIVFGLFGMGFFIHFMGGGIDKVFFGGQKCYGEPCVLWAAATMAVLTLPVMIVATEEALRAVPAGLREASLALGATKLKTILKIVLPQALPGIMTGVILAVGRGAGEVAPIMFTGVAYYVKDLPTNWTSQFMNLGYHVYVLCTQSPNVEQTKPILYGTVLVLLILTFLLNLAGVIVRSRIRAAIRRGHI
jgi:phosphate transport system permease protein